jgi:hypothetical protein
MMIRMVMTAVIKAARQPPFCFLAFFSTLSITADAFDRKM